MKAIKYCALAALVSLGGAACQGAPDDAASTANAPSDVAAAGETVADAAADTADQVVAVAEEAPRITAEQLAEVFAGTEVFLLDVRRPEELEELGTVDGYTNIPIDELADRLDELPRDRPILTA